MIAPLTPYLLNVLKLYAARDADGMDPLHPDRPILPGKLSWLQTGFPQLAERGLIQQVAGVWTITDDGKSAIEQAEKAT